MSNNSLFEGTKRLMGALLRMPPKLHSEMKLGTRKPKRKKRKLKAKKSPKRQRGKSKARRA